MLRSIQAGRGIAAVLVLLYHLNNIVFGTPKYFPTKPFGTFFDMGHAGVDFFFVLSGFIIMYVHRGDIGHPEAAGRYLFRRLVRIYPIYWIALALVLPPYLAMHGAAVADIASSVLLIEYGEMILGPAWTLCHEVMFYAAFLALIVAPPLGVALIAAQALLSPFNVLFPIGMGAAILLRSSVRLPAGPLLIVGAAAFLACGLAEPYDGRETAGMLWRLGYGVSAAAMIVGAARLEAAGRIATPAAMLLLGEASYSIYLTHYPVLIGLGKLAVHIPAPGWLLFPLIGAATLACGIAFHLIAEKPLLRWAGSRRLKPSRP